MRYLGLDVLARCRINFITDTEPENGGDNLPALTARTPRRRTQPLHHYPGLDLGRRAWQRDREVCVVRTHGSPSAYR